MLPCTAQHSTAQHSTAQHSTAQHSTAQHSTAQHSTAQRLHNYIISLKTATVRRQHISTLFAKQHIDFQFYDAITPGEQLDNIIKTLCPNLLYQDALSHTEKACLISHIMLWKKCVDENLPYIGIFEDDILLRHDAQLFLKDTDWLVQRFKPNEFFILKVETYLQKSLYKSTAIPLMAQHSFHRLRSRHLGTGGYILPQHVASYLLHTIMTLPAKSFLPADVLLFGRFDLIPNVSVYQLSPAICVQISVLDENTVDFATQIQRHEIPLEKLSPWKKIIREIKKIPRGIKRLRYQIIPF